MFEKQSEFGFKSRKMNFRKYFILAFGLYLFLLAVSYTSYYVGSEPLKSMVTLNGVPRSMIKSFLAPIFITKSIMEGSGNEVENDSIPGGVKYYGENAKTNRYNNLDLLTGYRSDGDVVIELVDLQSGKSIKKWFPDIGEITKRTKKENEFLESDWSVTAIVHPLMLKDSSVVFGTWQSAVKINADSEIDWFRADYKCHHAIEKDHEGNLWFSGRRHMTKLKGLLKDDLLDEEKIHFIDDLVMKINPENSKVLFEKSVIELLTENNLGHLIDGNGYYDLDPIHLNDVQPALSDGEYWKKGDLLLSLRHISVVLLYRPSENKVLWHRRGPWLSQHDADFVDKNKISILGNQIYRGEYGVLDSEYINNPSPFNSVFVYNFAKDSISEPYKKFIEAEKIKTITEGRSEILPNGDLFIEETNFGRLFIGDTLLKKMSFSKRLNEEKIASLYWSRLIKN